MQSIDPSLRRALAHVAPHARRLVLVVLLSLTSTLLALALPYLTKDLVDGALVAGDSTRLRNVLLAFAAIALASFVLNVVSGLRYTRVSADILFDMRLELYRHLQRLSPRYYARTRLGDIVARLNSDLGEIQRVAAETVLAVVGNVLFLIGTVAVMMWLDVRLFLVGTSVVPGAVWALARYRRQVAGRVAELRQSSADVGSFLIETLQGMKLVVTSNAQSREAARFKAANDRFIRALMAMQLATYLCGGIPGLLLSGGMLLVLGYGGSRVIAGTLTLGTFVAFMAYHLRLLAPLQALMGLYANLATVKVSLRRVHEILDEPPDVIEDPAAAPLASARGDIVVENVGFSFDRGAPVLDAVSFTVRAGECVAIVGPSGGGKSTLGDLLLRLIDPDEGRIRLDGRDLRTLRLEDLRRLVAHVDQEPFMFNASIAENIRYARPGATEADVIRASRSAGIHGFIEGLREGYGTRIGERGMALSAGERQRVAIARAFLSDPVVLVLDEATASLDPVAERDVIAGYAAVMQGRTTILITHRLHMAAQADRVLVLRGAAIVEEGAAGDLLQTPNGAFAGLFGMS